MLSGIWKLQWQLPKTVVMCPASFCVMTLLSFHADGSFTALGTPGPNAFADVRPPWFMEAGAFNIELEFKMANGPGLTCGHLTNHTSS